MYNEATAAARYDDETETAPAVENVTKEDFAALQSEQMDHAPATKQTRARKVKTVENSPAITDAPNVVYLLQKGDEKPLIVGDARKAAAQAILGDLRLYKCEEITPDSVFAQ